MDLRVFLAIKCDKCIYMYTHTRARDKAIRLLNYNCYYIVQCKNVVSAHKLLLYAIAPKSNKRIIITDCPLSDDDRSKPVADKTSSMQRRHLSRWKLFSLHQIRRQTIGSVKIIMITAAAQ